MFNQINNFVTNFKNYPTNMFYLESKTKEVLMSLNIFISQNTDFIEKFKIIIK